MRSSRPAILFIFITLLLDVLGFGLIIPVAPRLVEKLMHAGEAQAAPVVAWLAATYALMQFVFAPALGALSDRFGRRPVLLVSVFGSGLDYFAMALAPTVPWLFLTRAINGISGASMTTCNAYIADVTPPEKRAAGFGMVGAAFGLGFILGPLIGGILGKIDIHYPFYAAGSIALLNWLYGFFVLPESLPPERRSRMRGHHFNPLSVLVGVTKYPFVLRMAAVLFLFNLAQFSLHTTWVLYTKHRYNWDERAVGFSLFVVGISAALVQAGLARRVIPLLGERRTLLWSLPIAIAAYAGYGASTQGWMIYGWIAIGSLGGLSMPAGQSLITRCVRPDEQGAVQGSLTGLQGVANVLGPLLGGHVFAASIADNARVHIPGAVFFVCAALSALGWLVCIWAVRKAPADAVATPVSRTAGA